jgi:hypothetical protein
LKTDIGHDRDDKADRNCPRQLVAALAPKSPRGDPEAREQIVLSRLLRLLRGQFRIGFNQLGRRWLDLIAGFGDDFDEW